MSSKKPIGLTAIVKPTHSCNLTCRYCYVEESAEQGVMSNETLENSISKVIEFNGTEKETHFIWHGGEPLLMGLDFFKRVVEIQNRFRPNYTTTNGIQSNGTLVTEELLDFIEEQKDFHLGLSLDGPPELHNQTRRYKDDTGSFDDVMKGIELCQSRDEVGGGVITVLTKVNLPHIESLYRFLKKRKINLKVNPLIKSGKANQNYDEIAISPEEYGNALKCLFDIWFYDPTGTEISVSPLDRMVGNIITNAPLGCNYSKSCQKDFISIGPLGDVYPCGRFDGVEEFKYGNINTDSIEFILSSEMRSKLLGRSTETVEGCAPCEYKKICNSGCVNNAYMVNGNIMGKDYYCLAYKMIFEHITKALKDELRKAEVKNG